MRILLVDDEQHVLDSMREALRPYRPAYTASFAASGREALALLATERFDVVVSDLRMPEMDGAVLLGEVLRRHPETVRMLLSGQTEIHQAARAAAVAHVLLAKPCGGRELLAAIESAPGCAERAGGRA
jgi:DNA-binding NtrC family response regulator